MVITDQNSALNSIHEFLVPGSSLVDGRTEQDWLRFLSDFASLINFYDQDNTIKGNWAPFLLKDPIFLMAAISKTAFVKLHSLYLRICHKLEQLFQPGKDQKDLPVSLNQLFDHLTGIFMQIKQWVYYMQRSAEDYPLKAYAVREIKKTFSSQFRSVISLRQELFSSSVIPGIRPPDLFSYQFDTYDERIWTQNTGQPFWEVLGLLHPLRDNSAAAIFKAITAAGDLLFNFFQVIITYSNVEFERLTTIKSSYPDTTLLRTFINLLQIHQGQLNELGNKHLQFYYHNILKQKALSAVADHAFICAGLAKKDALVKLPSGTLFDAGIDAQKNAVVFESLNAVTLNPAVITGAYTLSGISVADGLSKKDSLSSFHLQTIASPGAVQVDADGKILSWDTFGSLVSPAVVPSQQLGIAFASPMLLLREGVRTIKISIGYTGVLNPLMLKNASCYLSTQLVWFSVTANFQPDVPPVANVLSIEIDLKATDPAIESFLLHPDGLKSSWPMFKILFEVADQSVPPPVLHSFQIETHVSGIENLQLYNDYGALSTKTPYPLFGPTPLSGAGFMIGSNEIFSKPLLSLSFQLDWDLLPADFAAYYHEYNLYLNNKLTFNNTQPEKPSLWTEIGDLFKSLFTKKTVASGAAVAQKNEGAPFNNGCFEVEFQILQTQSWKPVVFKPTNSSSETVITDGPRPLFVPVMVSPAAATTAVSQADVFVVNTLELSSAFSSDRLTAFTANPDLQLSPLKFTGSTSSGFLKLMLSNPDNGFGSAIYPNVVSAIALNNARLLYGKDDVTFVNAAKLPFAPKLKKTFC